MKSYYLMAIHAACVAFILTAFIQPANAASIINVDANGNNVTNYGSMPGLSVEFYNQETVSITFDNSGDTEDQVSMHFYNSTGVGWSGFEFQLIGAGFAGSLGPLTIEPQTTTLSSYTVHATDFETINDVHMTHFTLGFDGLETYGLLNGIGTFINEPDVDYTLLLTPTTVPVPAAVWLFGSGLIGLIGIARRKAQH